ncbi:MAG: methyltransferase domain-containing protein [Elusimicrobiales bacterium]
MKLNIGCGYNRLEGWFNVDNSADSAADRLMEAHDLRLESGSADEIKALQLVEHLGFFKTKYFFSECWRVLKPGGLLTLETPDIEKTFSVFLSGDAAAREAALGWIYGPETAGMGHAYCFPKELLSELLAEAGFETRAVTEFLFQAHRPALRFEAEKKEGERAAVNAAMRRRLLDKGLAVFRREEESAGLELAVRHLAGGAGDPGSELEQALISAPAALEYFTLAEENEQRPSPAAAACARLLEWDLQGRMFAEFLANYGGGKDAERVAASAALALGRELLKAAQAGAAAPHGPAPAEGAPAVFTLEAAAAWAFRLARRR